MTLNEFIDKQKYKEYLTEDDIDYINKLIDNKILINRYENFLSEITAICYYLETNIDKNICIINDKLAESSKLISLINDNNRLYLIDQTHNITMVVR